MSDFLLHCFKYEDQIVYNEVTGVVSPKFYGLVNVEKSESRIYLLNLDANNKMVSAGRNDDEAERNVDILYNSSRIGTTNTWGPFILKPEDFILFITRYLRDLEKWHITVHQDYVDSIAALGEEPGNKVLYWR